MTLPICDELHAFDRGMPDFIGGPGECHTVTLRNPDGPEAAYLIETLVDALAEIAAIGGDRAVLNWGDAQDAIDIAKAALALARGENTPGSEEMK